MGSIPYSKTIVPNFSRLGWYHIQAQVPETWEITHYGIDEVEGRLDFCNRQWHQARFSWKKGKTFRKPDIDRTLNEFHKRYLLQHHQDEVASFSSLSSQLIGPFVFAHGREGRPCQAAYYLDQQETILIWTFPSFSESLLRQTIKPILESYEVNEHSKRYWSAFGLSFELDRDFDLEDADIYPANVSLCFEHKNRQQATFHRWGLPEELLRGQDLKTFYYRVLGGLKNKVMSMEDTTFRGMESVVATLSRTGTHAMDKLYGGFWKGTGRIWYNREEQRLYAFEEAGPKKAIPLKVEELLLW